MAEEEEEEQRSSYKQIEESSQVWQQDRKVHWGP